MVSLGLSRRRELELETYREAFEELCVAALKYIDFGVMDIGVRADILEAILVAEVFGAGEVGGSGSAVET